MFAIVAQSNTEQPVTDPMVRKRQHRCILRSYVKRVIARSLKHAPFFGHVGSLSQSDSLAKHIDSNTANGLSVVPSYQVPRQTTSTHDDLTQ